MPPVDAADPAGPAGPAGPDATAVVLCVGEVMAQVVPADGARFAAAERFAVGAAGAELNVAVGLRRLGVRAELLTLLGDDAVGDRLLHQVEAAGVGTRHVGRRPGARSGLFVKDPDPAGSRVGYYRGGSAAAGLAPADVDAALTALAPAAVHVSGVTPALSADCLAATRHLLRAGRAAGALTSFDVNHRPVLWPSRAAAADVLAELADASRVVFVGLDEATALWGVASAAQLRALLPGPDVLVVKDGPRDARSHDRHDRGDRPEDDGLVDGVAGAGGGGWVVEPAGVVEVVEPVGAGDAFAAGWLAATLRGGTAAQRLRAGHRLAGAVLRSVADHADPADVPDLAQVLR